MNSPLLSDSSLSFFSLGLLVGAIIGTTGVVIILLIGVLYYYRESVYDIVKQMISKSGVSQNTNYQLIFDFLNSLKNVVLKNN